MTGRAEKRRGQLNINTVDPENSGVLEPYKLPDLPPVSVNFDDQWSAPPCIIIDDKRTAECR